MVYNSRLGEAAVRGTAYLRPDLGFNSSHGLLGAPDLSCAGRLAAAWPLRAEDGRSAGDGGCEMREGVSMDSSQFTTFSVQLTLEKVSPVVLLCDNLSDGGGSVAGTTLGDGPGIAGACNRVGGSLALLGGHNDANARGSGANADGLVVDEARELVSGAQSNVRFSILLMKFPLRAGHSAPVRPHEIVHICIVWSPDCESEIRARSLRPRLIICNLSVAFVFSLRRDP